MTEDDRAYPTIDEHIDVVRHGDSGSDSIHCPGNNNRLIEIVPDAQPLPIVPRQGTPLMECRHNLDMSTPRGKALALRAVSPATIEMPSDGTLRIIAVAYIVIPDSQTDDKTGELREFSRVVLFDTAGKHYRTSAAHGPARLMQMCSLYTDDDWQRGIPLVVTVRKSKRGTTYHDIQIDLEGL